MRRSDREITDRNEMIQVMERCDVCRLVLNDGDYPYIVPLNFGIKETQGEIVLYFHGAREGKKYDLMAKNPHATFEMDCGHRLVLDEVQKNCTMEYESVIGRGEAMLVEDEKEREEAVKLLMAHYRSEDFPYNQKVLKVTNIFKLTVSEMTGKRRKKTR